MDRPNATLPIPRAAPVAKAERLNPIRSIQIALCPLHSLSKHYWSYELLCYREVVANDSSRGLSHVACDHFLPRAATVARMVRRGLTQSHLVAAGSMGGTPSMIGSGEFGSALRKSAARRVSKYAATSTKMIMVATPVSVVT